MSVQTLISSDLTRGKIKRAVLQSAGGLGGLSHDVSVEMRVKSSKELMESSARKTSKRCALSRQKRLLRCSIPSSPPSGLAWQPVVDNVLLKASVDEVALSGNAHDIDYMIGCTGGDIAAAR